MKKETDNSLTRQQKDYLRNRILRSARGEREREKERSRYFRRIVAAAACLAILFAVGYYKDYKTEPSLEDFVRTSPEVDLKNATGVTLILGNETNINLDEEDSRIQYSATGEQVDIGSGKKVNQKSVVNETAAFNTVLVPYGKRTNLELSDGTLVWLNSGSKLVYPAVFNGKSRSVFLEGEAIFDVAHNTEKPFKVVSGSQEIEVLGTVFNVTSYAGDKVVETVLKSGSINLTYKDKDKQLIRLTPGTKASFDTRTAEVQTEKVNVGNYFSWKEGLLTLDRTSLKEIMRKLSRYYGVDIVIKDKDLAAQSFSGNLDLKEDLDEVIELVRHTSHFEIEKNEDGIFISKQEPMK